MAVLLGRTSAGSVADFASAGRTAAWPFVAAASGELTYIYAQTKVANTATGHRLGIYANSGGAPGARLGVASVTIGAPNGTGVFGAQLASPVTIVSGTTYHLASYAVGDNFDYQGTTNTGAANRETGVLADFPDPFGSFTGPFDVEIIIWGEDAVSPLANVQVPANEYDLGLGPY